MDSVRNNNEMRPFPLAMNVQRAASRLGFDWPDITGVFDKVAEELAELRDAERSGDNDHARAELGDLLFAAVSVARFLDADPEQCLHEATKRFQSRLDMVAKIAEKEGVSLQSCAAERLDALWEQAKRLMRQQLEKDLDKHPCSGAD